MRSEHMARGFDSAAFPHPDFTIIPSESINVIRWESDLQVRDAKPVVLIRWETKLSQPLHSPLKHVSQHSTH